MVYKQHLQISFTFCLTTQILEKKGVAFTLVFTVIFKSFWLLYSTMISLVMVSNSISFPSFSLTQSYPLQLNYLYLLSFQHKFLILLHVFIHCLFHSSSKNRTHCVYFSSLIQNLPKNGGRFEWKLISSHEQNN